jgi:hypothetical protein
VVSLFENPTGYKNPPSLYETQRFILTMRTEWHCCGKREKWKRGSK